MTAGFHNFKLIKIDSYGFNDIQIEVLTNKFQAIVSKLVPSKSSEAWLESVSASSNSDDALQMLITFKATNIRSQWQGIVYDGDKVFIITTV